MIKDIIVGVSGSIAAYKAIEIVNQLTKKGSNVQVVMTSVATKFVSPLTFQTISKNPVFIEMFEKNKEPLHISLAERAGLILLAPATANIIGKLANGICDDLLTNIVIATKAKVLLAPAMNDNMYQNAIVQENIKRLQKRRYQFISPVYGDLACGEKGEGHLASVETIVEVVLKHRLH
ncbi:MAG: hypothetical protein B5M48_00975 [Candidatus Omnitrophica bacterium 4484_213]|nr:MAG: hypothetical protein B5M48_00975 [Candidatus Omnitrophica bacterium 4484_213]